MIYKIRSSVTDHDPGKDAAYRTHLRKYDKKNDTALWRYFYWDFFHDGVIENIKFSPDLSEASFEIWCPNIKRYVTEQDYEYVNAKFICTFQSLKWFVLESDEDESATSGGKAYFLSSEINTLDDQMKKYSVPEDEYEMSSLIIELDSGYMSLVFWSMRVEAVEPLAFSLMLSDKQHEVPIFMKEDESS
ncbi:MAG TPA: hypothetical protein VI298_14515 [Geobacteraceae bacterium]